MHNMLSVGDSLRFIGTAPDELWLAGAVREGLAAHFNEVPPNEYVEELFCEAFECGNAGWSLSVRRIKLEGVDAAIDFRVSLVFSLEGGSWKVVHRHASVGTPNMELHGVEHHALADLAKLALSADPLRGHTGIAAVMFTDIADSTVLAAAIGDSGWTKAVQAHLALVSETVKAGNGRLIKSLGDGTMSVFASARAAMETAQRLQRQFSEQISEPVLQVRIGVHTGDVVASGDDYFGSVVNMAARITALTAPGQIRVSDATRAMIGGARDFSFGDPATVTLRGLEGTHLIHVLRWQDNPA